jgi:hypothetical protein
VRTGGEPATRPGSTGPRHAYLDARRRVSNLATTILVVGFAASAVISYNLAGIPGRPLFDVATMAFGSAIAVLLFASLKVLANGPFRVRFCSTCGRAMPFDSAFCPYCGRRIG